jgi:hypothetical protein
MGKISPDEILQKYGTWIGHADFIKLIAKKRQVGERQAQNLLTASIKKGKKIKKFVFRDRTTIYGLEEFGPPTQIVKINANYLTSNWDLLLIRAEKAGGSLVEVEFEKLDLGDQDTITGHYERIYHKKPIQGIFVLEGAIDLQRAIGLGVTERHHALFLTKEEAEEGDRLWFRKTHYYIKDVKEIDEGINFSYNIFKMVRILY